MTINIPTNSTEGIMQKALEIASGGGKEIDAVLKDIQGDGTTTGDQANILGDSIGSGGAGIDTGKEVLEAYGYSTTNNPDISTASGAMVIDDLMQKISTKVQVAAQLLSTANTINKTVSRIMQQG